MITKAEYRGAWRLYRAGRLSRSARHHFSCEVLGLLERAWAERISRDDLADRARYASRFGPAKAIALTTHLWQDWMVRLCVGASK